MNIQNIKDTLRVEARRVTTWGRLALLAALPFASEIRDIIKTSLPDLQPYLPENIYKFMGGAVVVVGMLISLVKVHGTVKAANDA